jgi:transposase
MKRFIQGDNRSQSTLFPELLDDYISEENEIRVIDVFVDSLDLSSLGFAGIIPKHTGRPSYHPSVMLKLYIYGYLNRVQTSRRLEKETHRNVELMWLTSRLTPDYKTIADFRKNNGKAIISVCRSFIELCRKLNLFDDAVITVDGSKFKGVNNKRRNYTKTSIIRRIEIAEKHVEKYLARLDELDNKMDSSGSIPLVEKLARIKVHLKTLKDIESKIVSGETSQVSLTDPDCRAMKSNSIGRTIGYNVQTAVDTKHHLIVGHYVTNAVVDRAELSKISEEAQAVLDQKNIIVLADRGYYSANEIKKVQDAGMTPIVPKTQTSGSRNKNMFTKDDFYYSKEKDVYICPNKKEIPYSFSSDERGKTMRGYVSVKACKDCPIKGCCTTSKARRVRRWEHEERLEEMEIQLQSMPNAMSLRQSTVEHPYGTIKARMGATHFQTRTLKNVKTEMSLHVLTYNLTRMINIFGVKSLQLAMKA